MKDGRLKANIVPILALATVISTFGLFGLAFFLKTEREILGKREQIAGRDKRKTYRSGWRIKNQRFQST